MSVALHVGQQSPRVRNVPESVSSAGDEAIDLAAAAGLELDPWQQLVLRDALGEREDGKWSAFEVGLVVPRQNGKGSILEARELAGLFLFGEQLIVHSAHQQRTSSEHFRRMRNLINNSGFSDRVESVKMGKGAESIELKNGARIVFITRTSGGGRGITGDLTVLDEAMILSDEMMESLMSTMSARSIFGNPQMWYAGSAVDQQKQPDGRTFSAIRARGHTGDDRLAFFEWSPPFNHPDEMLDKQESDPDVWAMANPALGIRISGEFIEAERRTLSARGFATERLCVGDWPDPDGEDACIIKPAAWQALTDGRSGIDGQVVLAIDTSPDRERSAIAAAGSRGDGRRHVEVLRNEAGTGWVVDAAEGYVQRHSIETVLVEGASPAASLVPELQRRGINVVTLNAREYANACGELFDAVQQDKLRHRGDRELSSAVCGATTRNLGDAWAWSRRSSVVDISPLVACTLAHYGAANVDDVPFTFEVLG